ncbi:hypothetical protein HN51_029752 [Arachis hypogaea]
MLGVLLSALCSRDSSHQSSSYACMTTTTTSSPSALALTAQQADSYKAKQNPRPLCDFFANSRVIAVGMEIENVKAKLEKHHGIELKKALDLRAMAVEGMKEVGEKVDLWRYNLDKLAKTVLGEAL